MTLSPQQHALVRHAHLYRAFLTSDEYQLLCEKRANVASICWSAIVGEALAVRSERLPEHASFVDVAMLILHELPRIQVISPREADELLEELVVWFRFVARSTRSTAAIRCVEWLRSDRTRRLMAHAIERPRKRGRCR